MSIFYDPVSEGFYHKGIQTFIPKTAIEITRDEYLEFQRGQCKGLKVVLVDGKLSLTNREVKLEDLRLEENSFIDRELLRARDELEKVQDSDAQAFGTVAQWREYRKALRAWSEHKEFPSKEFRPVAPDA